MKQLKRVTVATLFLCMLAGKDLWAGEMDALVNILVKKGVLSPSEAQNVVNDARIESAKDLARMKSISTMDWTERIKMSGDVRYRTQGDWGKNNTNLTSNPFNGIEEQRFRNRIRGRFALEGKVNDFTYAGTRIAGGDIRSNSTNDTLDQYFNKKFVMFDQYYMRLEMPQELAKKYSNLTGEAKLWAGKFQIPYECSELVWDSDINPGGVALQYASPEIYLFSLPVFKIYSNLGYYWLDESANINTDPILWAPQVGIKTKPFGPLNSTLNVAAAIYDFANLQSKTPGANTVSAGTNSRWTAADLGGVNGAKSPLLGSYRYEFNVFDLYLALDNEKFADWAFPNGFYADFIHNASAPSENSGCLIGAYIGKKKLKEPRDWKIRVEWRYTERDAVPDFMPDSDFYGFGTYPNTTTSSTNGIGNWGDNGLPRENGTNGKGVNMALEYMMSKNTTLNMEYYWCKPIKSDNNTAPWNELQIDVVTKF